MRGSERMLMAVFWARAWRRTLRSTPTLSTEVLKRLPMKSSWVPSNVELMPRALSGLVGVMAELDQRRPRAVASSTLISAMMAEMSTWRPGLSRSSMSRTTDSWYSGAAMTMTAVCRQTGTMRTLATRVDEPAESVGGRARCHQKEMLSVVVAGWLAAAPPAAVAASVAKGETLESSSVRPDS